LTLQQLEFFASEASQNIGAIANDGVMNAFITIGRVGI
jgi:hypothetical protein